MSTAYRVTIHCDEVADHGCAGLTEARAPEWRDLTEGHVMALLDARGWLRGYRAKGTYDVCPNCRKIVEQRLKETPDDDAR